MDRRDFFKRAGLGLGGLFVAKGLLASQLTDGGKASQTLQYVVEYLTERGALYADARIGPCELIGRDQNFLPNSLFRSELLGVRVAREAGWRHAVISDLEQPALDQSLDLLLEATVKEGSPPGKWVTAQFDMGRIMAGHSSDPEVARELNQVPLRFTQKAAIPQGSKDLLFCDLLIEE